MYACIANKSKTLELLCKHGANLQARDANGRTSLLWAAYYGHHEVLRTLLRADKSLIDMLDPHGRSGIHWSTKHPNSKCLEVLLKYASLDIINLCDQEQVAALHWSALCHHPEHTLRLIKAGARIDVTDHEGRTPIHYAVSNDSQRCLKACYLQDVKEMNGWLGVQFVSVGCGFEFVHRTLFAMHFVFADIGRSG